MSEKRGFHTFKWTTKLNCHLIFQYCTFHVCFFLAHLSYFFCLFHSPIHPSFLYPVVSIREDAYLTVGGLENSQSSVCMRVCVCVCVCVCFRVANLQSCALIHMPSETLFRAMRVARPLQSQMKGRDFGVHYDFISLKIK